MSALGMEGMILRYLLSGTQADSAGRKFDEPLVNSMGIGIKSTQQKAAASTKFESKRERSIAAQHRRRIVTKPKKAKKMEPKGLTKDKLNKPLK